MFYLPTKDIISKYFIKNNSYCFISNINYIKKEI